jgi:hypothetical protein
MARDTRAGSVAIAQLNRCQKPHRLGVAAAGTLFQIGDNLGFAGPAALADLHLDVPVG